MPMWKLLLLSLVLVSSAAMAQVPQKPLVDTLLTDSTALLDTKEDVLENVPTVTVDESDATDEISSSPILLSSRDPFFSASVYNFSTGRVSFRGNNGTFNTTYINGVTMENLERGFTPYGQWSGLNHALRNRQIAIGLAPNSFGFGNLGTAVNIDARASKQYKQTRVAYSYSNGAVNHNVTFIHSTGLSKKGWAFSVAGAFRGADEGYIAGTYTNNYSYFASLDKKFGKHLISLTGFAAHTEAGQAGISVQEMQQLTGDKYYNPYWGYQNGKKRNSAVSKSNQPVLILSHEFNIAKNSSLQTSVGYTFGDRSRSALEYFNVTNPFPDYYRYLPSYQEDEGLTESVREKIMSDINLQQINWDALYASNRSNSEVFPNANGVQGNNYSGLRSNYWVENRVTNTKRGSVRTVFNQKINRHIDFSWGFSHQREKNNYYKQMEDLLGGNYIVDLNQFAERDFPSDPNAIQNDLNHPNRIIKVGDRFGYDYDIDLNKTTTWTQGVFKYGKLDLFGAVEGSNTQFYREGHTRFGLFPNNSFGKSTEYSFNNYAFKAGIGYRFSTHNYIYVNAAQLTRAPFYQNVYLSPRTRDFAQDNVKSELIKSIEGGYVMTAPFIKMRLSGYYTTTENQLQVITFYDDALRTFVSNGYNNISRLDFGGELGLESRAIKNVILSGAAAVGRHYWNGRPEVIVTSDNSAALLDKATLYTKNYRIGTMPQEAYTFGVQYRSPKYWHIGANINYFDQIWLSYNPGRRTVDIVQGVDYNSALWHTILEETRLPAQTTVDASAGYSWKLPASMLKRRAFFSINVYVRNVLDNQDLVTRGYEQLRFDVTNVDKFPPKYGYAFGRTYTVTAALRF